MRRFNYGGAAPPLLATAWVQSVDAGMLRGTEKSVGSRRLLLSQQWRPAEADGVMSEDDAADRWAQNRCSRSTLSWPRGPPPCRLVSRAPSSPTPAREWDSENRGVRQKRRRRAENKEEGNFAREREQRRGQMKLTIETQ
jgi:hypothetical protein